MNVVFIHTSYPPTGRQASYHLHPRIMSNTKTKYQKIIKVGNSYAVTLDSTFVKRHNLRVGEPMAATYRTDQPGVSFVPNTQAQPASEQQMSETLKKSRLAASITPELEQWTKKFLEDNKQAMEELANL